MRRQDALSEDRDCAKDHDTAMLNPKTKKPTELQLIGALHGRLLSALSAAGESTDQANVRKVGRLPRKDAAAVA